MFRAVVALVLTASSEASRVKVDGRSESKSQTKFGASCDDLQAMFHNRVVAFKSSFDANPDLDEIGRVAQARVMMRTYGIIRTLRRARTCSWVIENDSDDVEQAREIVQVLLAENPCADAARSQLATGASDAATAGMEVQSLYRAMTILASDNCELVESVESAEQTDNEATLDEEALDESALDIELSETEAAVQDAIDQVMDSSQDSEGAFIQTKSNEGIFGRFRRVIGVVFWTLFLLVACVSNYVIIGMLITLVLSLLIAVVSLEFRGEIGCNGFWAQGGCQASYMGIFLAMLSGTAGVAVGIVGCSYQLYNQLLPGQ